MQDLYDTDSLDWLLVWQKNEKTFVSPERKILLNQDNRLGHLPHYK